MKVNNTCVPFTKSEFFVNIFEFSEQSHTPAEKSSNLQAKSLTKSPPQQLNGQNL